jgi:hypothetical protein
MTDALALTSVKGSFRGRAAGGGGALPRVVGRHERSGEGRSPLGHECAGAAALTSARVASRDRQFIPVFRSRILPGRLRQR